MNRKRAVAWLYGEIPALELAGVLSEETGSRLHAHYGAVAIRSRRNVALMLLSILGAASIGLGVILLLAHNWDMLSRFTRTILAFLPLLVGQALAGWTIYRRPDSLAWKEGSGIFLTLAVGACISLISQTYHIEGHTSSFLMTWLLLAGPLVYVLNASSVALLYMVGITCWAGAAQHESSHALLFWPLAAMLAPHVWLAYRKAPEGPRSQLLLWGMCAILPIATGLVLERTMPGLWIVVYSGLFCTLLLAGSMFAHLHVLRIAGYVGSAVLTLVLTYEDVWRGVGWNYYRHGDGYLAWAGWQDYFFALASLSAVVLLAVRGVGRKNWVAAVPGALALAAVVGFAASAVEAPTTGIAAAFNLFALAFGGVTLVAGIRKNELLTINAGMGVLSMLIILRFFDADISFTIRGVLFILLGFVFLGTNFILMRRAAGHKETLS